MDSPRPGIESVPLRDDDDAWDDLAEALEAYGWGTFSTTPWSLSISCSVQALTATAAISSIEGMWRTYCGKHAAFEGWTPVRIVVETDTYSSSISDPPYNPTRVAELVGKSRSWVYAMLPKVGQLQNGLLAPEQVRDLALLASAEDTGLHPIARAREQHGLSQAQLAAELGVDVSTVSRWERGRSAPRASQRAALDRVLGIHSRDNSAITDESGETTEP